MKAHTPKSTGRVEQARGGEEAVSVWGTFTHQTCLFPVRGLLKGLLSPGEPEDAPAVPHRGEALCV